MDVVEIGSKTLRSGGVYSVKALGAYAMIDEGARLPIPPPPPPPSACACACAVSMRAWCLQCAAHRTA